MARVRESDFDESSFLHGAEGEGEGTRSVDSLNVGVLDDLDRSEGEDVHKAGHEDTFVAHEEKVRVVVGGHLALEDELHEGVEIAVVDLTITETVDNISEHHLNFASALEVFHDTGSAANLGVGITSKIDKEFVVGDGSRSLSSRKTVDHTSKITHEHTALEEGNLGDEKCS